MMSILSLLLTVLFILNVSSLFIIFIGWLTHAHYFDILYDKIDDVGIMLHTLLTIIIIVIAILASVIDGASGFFIVSCINAIYVAILILIGVVSYLCIYFQNLHEHFGRKRR